MLPHLRIKIRVSRYDIANKNKNLSSKLQYASSHAANDMTVKRVIADAGVSVDAKRRADEIWIQNSGIRTSLVNICRLKTRATKANTLMSPCWRVSQCSRHVYRLLLLLWQLQNAICIQFNRDHYRIIVSYRYRDNFDLSYHLLIENSI